MNTRIISTLVWKDVVLFFRNQFFALITFLALFAYAGIYFLMPPKVEETLTIGVYPEMPGDFSDQLEDTGLILINADSEEDLVAAIDEGEYNVGAVFADDFAQELFTGNQGEITLYFGQEIPEEVQEFYVLFFQELGFILKGQELNLEGNETVLGLDMVGKQIPFRDRMLPLFAVLIVMMEVMGMSTLITTEVESGAIRALKITPMKLRDLFLGKGIMGTMLAFSQAVILMMLITGFNPDYPFMGPEPGIILLTLFLASIMVTALGFLIASVAKDMMSSIGWSVPILVLLMLPTFGIMFPGSASDWVQLLPSHFAVETIHMVSNLGAGWPDVSQNLWMLAGYNLVLIFIGMTALRRKIR